MARPVPDPPPTMKPPSRPTHGRTSRASRTPAMQQYLAAKAEHPDALLLFRMGDFYELFFEDAVEAAQLLELTLTSRNKNDDDPIPMAGVPATALDTYVRRLLEAGRKVAVCEQVEDPSQAKGVVRREVVQVITPGVNLDPEGLDARANNFLAAVEEALDGIGLAWADASTGDFYAALVEDTRALRDELARIEPRELLVRHADAQRSLGALARELGAALSPLDDLAFDATRRPDALETLGVDDTWAPPVRAAIAAVLAYLERTHPAAARGLRAVERVDLAGHLVLDDNALAHLEVLRTLMGRRRKGSLLWVLDQTITPMGGRLLRRRLQMPLADLRGINRRLDDVEAFVEDSTTRRQVREALGAVHDLERLCRRAAAALASPRELAALRQSLGQLPVLSEALRGARDIRLRRMGHHLDTAADIHADLEATLADEPPPSLQEGGVIREGVDDELDELISLAREGHAWFARYEAEQRERTGIASLKVRFNRVFGYFIEVTKANVHLVPDDYFRKQTLANSERYYTAELKEYEEKVLSAKERRLAVETALFEALRARVAAEAPRLLGIARDVAAIDVAASLAEVAHTRRYCRPVLDRSRRLVIREGRHPVVEAVMRGEPFVPNDLELDGATAPVLLITGPNMAGKSTVMRQAALIALMAQAGSFVPATEAHIGLVDRIFTRVGAADDLAGGRSTFMVEMAEAAEILRHATRRSLVLLDEMGRGTSTFDGVSIAWATAEYLHDRVGARTLFATHYHELTELERTRPGIRNAHVAVKEWQDDIVFLRRLVAGPTSRSYGIQVARLAGLPAEVVERARQILRELEEGTFIIHVHAVRSADEDDGQLSLFGSPAPATPPDRAAAGTPAARSSGPTEVEKEIAGVDLTTMTPIEALMLLHRLQEKLRHRDPPRDE